MPITSTFYQVGNTFRSSCAHVSTRISQQSYKRVAEKERYFIFRIRKSYQLPPRSSFLVNGTFQLLGLVGNSGMWHLHAILRRVTPPFCRSPTSSGAASNSILLPAGPPLRFLIMLIPPHQRQQLQGVRMKYFKSEWYKTACHASMRKSSRRTDRDSDQAVHHALSTYDVYLTNLSTCKLVAVFKEETSTIATGNEENETRNDILSDSTSPI